MGGETGGDGGREGEKGNAEVRPGRQAGLRPAPRCPEGRARGGGSPAVCFQGSCGPEPRALAFRCSSFSTQCCALSIALAFAKPRALPRLRPPGSPGLCSPLLQQAAPPGLRKGPEPPRSAGGGGGSRSRQPGPQPEADRTPPAPPHPGCRVPAVVRQAPARSPDPARPSPPCPLQPPSCSSPRARRVSPSWTPHTSPHFPPCVPPALSLKPLLSSDHATFSVSHAPLPSTSGW